MNSKLVIGYFYKDLLNLYGDNGNVEILVQRAMRRNIDVEVLNISTQTKIDSSLLNSINLVFMGGGPDSSQKLMYEDLLTDKGAFLNEYIQNNGVGLYVCGSYQLLGNYYKSADGSVLEGLKIFDMYTQHFGDLKPRCIGNTVIKLNDTLLKDPVFKNVNTLDNNLVGFENHGGRTYIGENMKPLGSVIKGHGNNSEDKQEGVHFKNSIGTYFHGPVLSRNCHLADFLIAKALKLETLSLIDDTLIRKSHTASQKLR